MDIRKVKKLIELLEESDIAEIEIREGEESVRISRNYPQQQMHYAMPPVAGLNAVAPVHAAPTETRPAGPVYQGEAVKSPMVGTFYRSPSPTSAPFIEIGSQVKATDVICI